MSTPVYSVRTTLGALEAGGFVSIFLSGIVTMQSYLYYRVYPKDRPHIKTLVAALWLLDITHTILICISNWTYLVIHFGNSGNADHILTTVAVTIALTAVITFTVHAFFIHRIYVVSNKKAYIAIPLIILALFRLGAALVSTGEMIRLGSFGLFRRQYEYLFTMGLSAAVALDISVTLGLSYYLRKSKTGFTTMNVIIDILVLYTVETGIVTCAATIVSLICWVVLPRELIYLGLHFSISKLYANTFLATLNSRATLRARSMSSSNPEPPSLPPLFNDHPHRSDSSGQPPRADDPHRLRLQITVEKTVERAVSGPGVSHVELRTRSRDEATPPDERASYTRASSSRTGETLSLY